jgi:tetratricopeptide (TPR) repeat protein
MSDNHPTTREQDARRASFAAEPTRAADPLVLRRGLKGSWTRAILKMASQRMARRTMVLAVLLVLGMAASEARAQPRFGGPPMGGPPMGGPPMGGFPMGGPPRGGFPMGGPPMGGMMAPPRFGPPMGMGVAGRPGPGPIPKGAGGAPGFPGNRPPLSSSPAGLASGRPTPGRPVPGGAGGGPANLARVGAGGRPEPGRAYNPRHADWYHGGWADSRGGTSDKGRDSGAWNKARDYVREERARDYAAGLAWGLGGSGSSGYGSGYSSGTGYDSGSGTGYSSGYSTGYSTGSGTGSSGADANTSSDAASTDSDSSRTDAAQETKSDRQQDGAAAEQGDQKFDRARDAFKAGAYAAALDLTDEALKDVPGDPLVHEFKGVVLFARGAYAQAADEVHSVLAVRTGMDWATLIGLYPDVETYTGQLRALEDRCRQDAKAAAPRFVLAYQYLVAGHKGAAVARLKELLALEPGDRVASRLLASLTGTLAAPEPTRTVTDGDGAAGRPPAADLVGRWRAERDGSTFDLRLDDRGRFLWQAGRQGKTTARISGAYEYSANTLTLKAEDRSPLRVSVTALSPDSFRFTTAADIPGDPGLLVRRIAVPAAPDRDQHDGPRENR